MNKNKSVQISLGGGVTDFWGESPPPKKNGPAGNPGPTRQIQRGGIFCL